MRIASNMMNYNFLRSLNKSMEKENTLQQQLADGKAIHRPSDDPVNTVRDLHYTSNQVQNEQFQSNLSTAQSWMENTDGVMSDLSSIMIKAKELVVSADDTKDTGALNTIGAQIDGMINQIVQLGNTKIGTRYLFGGQNDSTQPFTRTTLKDPNSDLTQEVVLYNGDIDKMSMAIQSGSANPTQDSVNITGIEAFGPTENVFGKTTMQALNQLLEIKSELKKANAVSQTNSQGGVGTVGGAYTGTGYPNYSVRIDTVDTATNPGQITGASYSVDGGKTWTAVSQYSVDGGTNWTAAPTGAANIHAVTLSLPDGVTFNISTSTGNAVQNVYSFREPQAAFAIQENNTVSGAAVISGSYSGSGETKYNLRVDSVNSGGQIDGASYSADGGSTWTTLSNYKVTTSNTNGPMPTVSGGTTTLSGYTLTVNAVDSEGRITQVNGGAVPVSYEVAYDTDAQKNVYTSVISLPGGQTVKIPATSSIKANDYYVIDSKASPEIDTTTSGVETSFNLPNGNGITLHVSATTTANGSAATNKAGDTFAFTLPQGSGPDVKWLSAVATQEIDNIHSTQLQKQTELGTRMAAYEMASNILQNQNNVIQSDVAGAEDLNVPKAITDFNTAQNVYRSALAVGAKIMQKSLVDFLS